jgi:hypothetical protein
MYIILKIGFASGRSGRNFIRFRLYNPNMTPGASLLKPEWFWGV